MCCTEHQDDAAMEQKVPDDHAGQPEGAAADDVGCIAVYAAADAADDAVAVDAVEVDAVEVDAVAEDAVAVDALAVDAVANVAVAAAVVAAAGASLVYVAV